MVMMRLKDRTLWFLDETVTSYNFLLESKFSKIQLHLIISSLISIIFIMQILKSHSYF